MLCDGGHGAVGLYGDGGSGRGALVGHFKPL